MNKTKIAVSACLIGTPCRYDATAKTSTEVLAYLADKDPLPFCPEDACFGSPRQTMDLVEENGTVKAIGNENGKDLTRPILEYAVRTAEAFREAGVSAMISKARSPSCGKGTCPLYDGEKNLIGTTHGLFTGTILEALNIPVTDEEHLEEL